MCLFLASYFLFLLWNERKRLWLSLGKLAFSFLLFLGLSLPLLVPILKDLGTGPPLSFHEGLYPESLETILAPHSLRHLGQIGRFLGRGDPTSSYLYPGILALLFFGSGFGRKKVFFSLSLVVALLFGISPWAGFFLKPLHAIPVFGALFRGEGFITQGAFFFSVLAASGFSVKPSPRLLLRNSLLILALLFLMLPLSHFLSAPSHLEKILLWVPVLLIPFFILKKARNPIPLLVLFGLLDLVGTGSFLGFVQYPGPPKTVRNVVKSSWFKDLRGRMGEVPGRWRVLADQGRMDEIWLGSYPCFEMESVQGFQPQRNEAYFKLACRDLAKWKTDRLFFGKRAKNNFFKKTNLRWLVVGEFSEKVGSPWKWVGRFGPVRLYELPEPKSRFFLLPEDCFVQRSGVLYFPKSLEESKDVVLSMGMNGSVGGLLNVGDAAAVLHLGTVAFPGWRAFVDGNEVKPLALDGVFLGLRVPPGKHKIRVEYWPRGFGWSLVLGGGTLLLALGLVIGGFFGRRGAKGRRDHPTAP
jgi:hypothetical protein